MSAFVRSFLAFDIDNAEVRKNLADAQKLVAQTGADLKLVELENIHMTVRFLGDITLNMADKVFEEMKKVQFTPFNVQISGVGVFPSLSYPRVVWAGISEGADQLRNVFSQLEPRLQGLSFTPDPKGFSPHLTIARVRSARNKEELSEVVQKNAKYDFGVLKAECLRLKRSELTPKGPIYSTLKEYCPQRL
ncbi:MAG TPA: RNA 2',3'-cyclic phosphodiesterase [Candidatus Bathyarchaeia archaeon]|nr:RNA 2',3'-cyclic phosphodiesterase [Candidatus Bathyarchaeia archaeon]